jgi:hypothetical protein
MWSSRLPGIVGACALWLLAGPGVAQESTPAGRPAAQTFVNPAGVRIEVTPERANVSDADVLAALEEAARQVRQRLAVPPALPASTAAKAVPAHSTGPACPAGGGPCCTSGSPAASGDELLTGVLDDAPRFRCLPGSLLWLPPLANQHEPRMFARPTTLKNDITSHTLDAAIGGTAPIFRYGRDDHPREGIQFDIFAVAFPRFAQGRTQEDIDYRFGFPLTWASGPWAAKVAYEHTSSHIGDDFLREHPGVSKRPHIRDEMVCGLSYRFWDQLRVYGQFGYAAGFDSEGPLNRDRYDVGVEWSRQAPTGCKGQPFAALDLDIRGDENYSPNLTIEAGWEWLDPDALMSALRLAVVFYTGRSPYGQFFDRHEQWVGVSLSADF